MEYVVSTSGLVPSHWHFLGPHLLSTGSCNRSRSGSGSFWALLSIVEMSSHLSLSAVLARRLQSPAWSATRKNTWIKTPLFGINQRNSPDFRRPSQSAGQWSILPFLLLFPVKPKQLTVRCRTKSEPSAGCLHSMLLTVCCVCWAKGSWAMTSHEGTQPLSSSQPRWWWNSHIVGQTTWLLRDALRFGGGGLPLRKTHKPLKGLVVWTCLRISEQLERVQKLRLPSSPPAATSVCFFFLITEKYD